MPTMNNKEYQRKLIARVEALRAEAAMPMLRFRQQIGPAAARDWARFVAATDEEAWSYFSLKVIDRIANLFGVGAELLSFKSRTNTWIFESLRRIEERKLREPDGIYYLVREREEERAKQGLPPLIRFLDQMQPASEQTDKTERQK